MGIAEAAGGRGGAMGIKGAGKLLGILKGAFHVVRTLYEAR